jgi:hypothetical protein
MDIIIYFKDTYQSVEDIKKQHLMDQLDILFFHRDEFLQIVGKNTIAIVRCADVVGIWCKRDDEI